MDKLHELLNEFHLEKWERITIAWPDVELSEKEELALEATLISKKYWFIQRLVENDKINEKELEKADRPFDVGYATEETIYERALMLLSIQDEPLDFLASILK